MTQIFRIRFLHLCHLCHLWIAFLAT
jgi:hypothetical protein